MNLKDPKKNKEENKNLPQTHALDIITNIWINSLSIFFPFMYLWPLCSILPVQSTNDRSSFNIKINQIQAPILPLSLSLPVTILRTKTFTRSQCYCSVLVLVFWCRAVGMCCCCLQSVSLILKGGLYSPAGTRASTWPLRLEDSMTWLGNQSGLCHFIRDVLTMLNLKE